MGLFRTKKDKTQKTAPVASSNTTAPVVAPVQPVASKERLRVRGPFRAGTVLLAPHVTEKTSKANKANTYTFIVTRSSSKQTVRQAIQQLYGVKVASVNIIRESDEHRQTRFGSTTHRGRKKAMVTLPAGSSIDLSKAPKAQT